MTQQPFRVGDNVHAIVSYKPGVLRSARVLCGPLRRDDQPTYWIIVPTDPMERPLYINERDIFKDWHQAMIRLDVIDAMSAPDSRQLPHSNGWDSG